MKFPGRRDHKHYFPVSEKGREALDHLSSGADSVYIVGIDQLLVDIEINVDDSFLEHYFLEKGQSCIIDDKIAEEIYQNAKQKNLILGEYPGGAIGNTLHNYSILTDSPCVALGAINKKIEVGDYAFKYLTKTSSLVDLSYLAASDLPMGRALCFITPDMERTFAISKGCMNDYHPEQLPERVIKESAALLLSAYSLRAEDSPIYQSTLKAAKLAKEFNVPVVLSMGTSSLVAERRDFLENFIKDYVTVVAMNQNEAKALTFLDDPLLALEQVLNWCDLALVTVGKKGLYMGGHTEDALKRRTSEDLHTKSIVEYNKYEYSRAMRAKDCERAIKCYTHINPFKGGPGVIKNTNGAGDAALAAVLHDISANKYHSLMIPHSPKHQCHGLTYSSLSQISKYANRASFEVLIQNSPRLYKGLPAREDSLNDVDWEA